MNDTISQLDVNNEVEENDLEQHEDESLERNEVIVTLDGKDISAPIESLGLTMESSTNDILDAVKGIIEEAEGTQDGYVDAYGNYTYTVRKAMNSSTIYVYPKPVAG